MARQWSEAWRFLAVQLVSCRFNTRGEAPEQGLRHAGFSRTLSSNIVSSWSTFWNPIYLRLLHTEYFSCLLLHRHHHPSHLNKCIYECMHAYVFPSDKITIFLCIYFLAFSHVSFSLQFHAFFGLAFRSNASSCLR